MAINVIMPALEMAQDTGKVLSWMKNEGDFVSKGEPLLEIETDKAVVEIEAPAGGVLAGISARAGDVIPVGQTIAWIVQPGEAVPRLPLEAPAARQRESAARRPHEIGETPAATAKAEIRISPKARRLAKEKGIDVAAIVGSGSDGEILAADVEAAAGKAAGVAPAMEMEMETSVEILSTTARLMAQRTAQSWTETPHFFLAREVDATRLLEVHRRLGSEGQGARGQKSTLTDLLVFLTARLLEKHPRLNASWSAQGIRLNRRIHIGIAIAVADGTVVGVIPDANRAALGEIAAARARLSEHALAGKLHPAEIAGATFTISNLGMYDVDSFTAIIVPPQAAILAVGRIADRVVAVNGRPAVQPTLTLTLSSDHRVVDGARAAEFMRDLAAGIRTPQIGS